MSHGPGRSALRTARTGIRATTVASALTVAGLLLAGCGARSAQPTPAVPTSHGSPSASHTMLDGTVMSGSTTSGSSMPEMGPSEQPGSAGQMAGDHGRAGHGPSQAASMICGTEIRDAVGRNLDLHPAPAGLHSWSHRLFSCTYQLAGGELRLSVKDLDAAGPGRAYFDRLRTRMPGVRDIQGMASFGFPAFQTPRGDVVFIKDHKTLWVDASRLTGQDLPGGATREDVAYGVASAVIGCWTE